MNRDDILDLLRGLARSQGSYGRLLASLTEEGLEYLVEQEFETPLDLVLFIEQ